MIFFNPAYCGVSQYESSIESVAGLDRTPFLGLGRNLYSSLATLVSEGLSALLMILPVDGLDMDVSYGAFFTNCKIYFSWILGETSMLILARSLVILSSFFFCCCYYFFAMDGSTHWASLWSSILFSILDSRSFISALK